jgi:hypothetical protein
VTAHGAENRWKWGADWTPEFGPWASLVFAPTTAETWLWQLGFARITESSTLLALSGPRLGSGGAIRRARRAFLTAASRVAPANGLGR